MTQRKNRERKRENKNMTEIKEVSCNAQLRKKKGSFKSRRKKRNEKEASKSKKGDKVSSKSKRLGLDKRARQRKRKREENAKELKMNNEAVAECRARMAVHVKGKKEQRE
jgi:hypothetical protein